MSSEIAQLHLELKNNKSLVAMHDPKSENIYLKILNSDEFDKKKSSSIMIGIYEINEYNLKKILKVLENYYHDVFISMIEKSTVTIEIPIISENNKDKFYTQKYKPIGMLLAINLLSENILDDNFLRSYQKEGVKWLLDGNSKILADDMGLGKTLQSIKAIENLLNSGEIHKILIISPISLIKNWEIELKKWSSMISFSSFKKNKEIGNKEWFDLYQNNHILLTNYEQLRKEISNFNLLDFDLVIADEAHKVRNISSGISKGLSNIKRKRFWALTGTPIENKPKDLGNLLAIINPEKFSTLRDSKQKLFIQDSALPYVLRRTKTDVLKELPDVIEKNISLEFGDKQKAEYLNIWSRRAELTRKSGSHFSVLSDLRKACDLVGKESIKSEESLTLINKVIENNEKVIIFSFYIPILEHLKKILTEKKIHHAFITGEQISSERDEQISSFQENNQINVLLASARVASEGLNLTQANNVIFLNRWWNPSSNLQARDRVVRIGQEKKVFIYNLYIADTIEERLNEILEDKESIYREITDSFIENNEDFAKDLLNDTNKLK